MGMNGKPHFMSGPFQSAAECQSIIAKLTASCGEGGFHYTVPVHADHPALSGADWNQLSFEDDDAYDEEFSDNDESEESADDNNWPAPSGARVIVVKPDKR